MQTNVHQTDPSRIMATSPSARQQMLRMALSGLGDSEIRALDSAATEQSYPAGSIICREGDWASVFYVLIAGEIEISRQGTGQEIVLQRAGAPTYFGEVALLGDGTRSATIHAVDYCRTLEINKETFNHLALNAPRLRRQLYSQFSAYMRDTDRAIIAHLNRQNAELQTAYAHLAEQDQMRTEFISNMAHELRTPLTAIQGFLHLIQSGVVSGDGVLDGLGVIERNVEKMSWLVNNLLILYEMQVITPQYARVRLEKVIAAAEKEIEPVAQEQQVHVDVYVAPDVPPMQVDVPGLTLALRLLLDNALKFSPAGETVWVEVQCHGGDQVSIDIVDRGPGIPPALRNRVFEPFFHWSAPDSDPIHSGLGLGLSLANTIVARHGGCLLIMDPPGRDADGGTILRMLLPLQ